MEATREITGTVVPLPQPDIDTDQILPKQFLTRLGRSGFGECLLHDWRADPTFVLNDPRYAEGSILVAGRNFGCGSSREQAAWAIRDHGFRAVVAPSYGGLFQSNCDRSGVLAVRLAADACEALTEAASSDPSLVVRIDIADSVLAVPRRDWWFAFDIAPATRRIFLEGLDVIDRTLELTPSIEAHEARRASWLPRTEERSATP